jgi:hypothetical protein
VENSSALATSQDSPITFPANAFPWPWTILFLIGVAVILFVAMIVGVIVWAVSAHLDMAAVMQGLRGMPAIVIQGIAEIVTIGFIVLLLPVLAKSSAAQVGFRALSARQLGIIAIGALAMFFIVTPLASVLQTLLHFKTPEAAIALYAHATGSQRVLFAFFGIVIAPAFEEAVFRWTLFNALRTWWGFWPGAIFSSLLFGLAHAQPPVTPAMFACITFPLAVGGVVLCYVYARSNNAWASFMTHGAFNGLSLILLTLFPQLAK